MGDLSNFNTYDTTTTSTTTISTTTEFWSSEDDYDVAQMMTKRITYTIYRWLFRLIIMLGLMAVTTFVLVVPLSFALILINRSIQRVIARRRNYWENDEALMLELAKKVDAQMKSMVLMR